MTTNNAINNAGNSFLVPANNLSDLSNAATALINLGAFGIVNIQTFTSSGTYTPTANMKYCIIECWGSGGGGAGVANNATSYTYGAGGGAGSYSRIVSSAATIGASQTVTIGAAGTGGTAGANPGGAGNPSSVGSICIANGGGGGGAAGGAGAGGTSGTGDIITRGMAGFAWVNSSTNLISVIAGVGGSSILGGGGTGAGAAGTGHCSGGAGGLSASGSGSAAGGAGTAGYIVITEFIS